MGHSSSVYVHVIMYTTQGICVGVDLLYICMNEGSSPLVCGMLWCHLIRLSLAPATIGALARILTNREQDSRRREEKKI